MNEEIKGILDDSIKQRLSEFEYVAFENEETKTAVDCIERLYKLKLEEAKNEAELEEKRKTRESEMELKEKQLREQKVNRWFEGAITIGTAAASLIFYGIWMNKGFKFEESGTFTSTTFKGLFNRFRPTK